MNCICCSMCFLDWCRTKYLASLMEFWLSHQSGVGCYCSNPKSERICQSHKDSWMALTAAQYSSSVEERDRACCFLQAQVTPGSDTMFGYKGYSQKTKHLEQPLHTNRSRINTPIFVTWLKPSRGNSPWPQPNSYLEQFIMQKKESYMSFS